MNNTLRELTLSDLHFDDLYELAGALLQKDNSVLTHLKLTHCMIDKERAYVLAAALRSKSLTSLDLEACCIESEGAVVLAAALKDNKTLTSLDLRNNNIGARDAQALVMAFKTNHTLTALYLDESKVSQEQMRKLEKALKLNKAIALIKDNKTPASLDLSWSDIGPEGARALVEALKENDTLTSLYLSDNKIGPEGARALAGVFEKNLTLRNLSILSIWGNDVPNKLDNEIDTKCRLNREREGDLSNIRAKVSGIFGANTLEDAKNPILDGVLDYLDNKSAKSLLEALGKKPKELLFGVKKQQQGQEGPSGKSKEGSSELSSKKKTISILGL